MIRMDEQLNQRVLIEKFKTFQDFIEILVSNTVEKEAYHQFRETFESTYFDLIGEVRHYLRRAWSLSASRVNIGIRDKVPLRLPSIPLPNFHDDPHATV